MMFSNSGINYYLTGTNSSFGGGVAVGNGTLYFNKLGSANQNSSLGTNGTITVGGPSATTTGGLRWIGTTEETSDKTIVLAGTTGGLTLLANGATNASLTISGNINSTGVGSKTLTFGGYSTNTLTLNGVINENGGVNSVVIGTSSSGTVVLGNNNNSFSGAITVTNATSGQYTYLRTDNIGNAGANSSLGKNGTINIGSSSSTASTTLRYTGTGENVRQGDQSGGNQWWSDLGSVWYRKFEVYQRDDRDWGRGKGNHPSGSHSWNRRVGWSDF